MEVNLNNITFIIVTFKSEKIINDCLDTLPVESKKIIVENSENIILKNEIESKYDNIEVILSKNNGMGASTNIGLNKCKTQFAYVLNPDTRFKKNTMQSIIGAAKQIKDFAIISPLNSNSEYPNFKTNKKYKTLNENILEVDYLDGFSMLINLNKYDSKNLFDENIFLFLENDDLCLKTKQKCEKIYIIKNSSIDHLGFTSSNQTNYKEIEYLRNWHWMWSKFYYNKKHKGYLFSLLIIFPHLLSGLIKFLLFILIFNNHKRKIYWSRVSGIVNSMIGKSSWLRLNQ